LSDPEERRREQSPDQDGGREIEENLPERFQKGDGLRRAGLKGIRLACRSISPRPGCLLKPQIHADGARITRSRPSSRRMTDPQFGMAPL
jgi:hypothetical protein